MDNLNLTALARNQNNVSDWSDMSTRGLLFQWASTIKKIQLSVTGPHLFYQKYIETFEELIVQAPRDPPFCLLLFVVPLFVRFM
jgi:hypothetical protein